jgi:hypothetical protein
VHLPVGLHATRRGLKITFSGELDREASERAEAYTVKTWDIKRSARYGSNHYNEKQLRVTAASLSADGKTVTLDVPDIRPTWCMSVGYRIRGANGASVENTIHNTVHHLGEG